MVDVARAFAGNPARAMVREAGAERMVGIVQRADFGALQAYERFCRDADFAPAQHPHFVRGFASDPEAGILIATVSRDGRPLAALPLEIRRIGPFTIAGFAGGSHANGNFPALARGATAAERAALAATLASTIATARPDIDALVLERQAETLAGVANPLLGPSPATSPNVALAVDLSGGFEAVLSRSSGKRKRKKHRSQTRKFEAAGGFARLTATTPEEVDRLLDAFFAMKTVRFQKMGVADVFGPEEVRSAFRSLFKASLGEGKPAFVLHALEVGGTIRAVTGSSRAGSRLVCEFGAILEDELAHASPGDFLFFENIRDACQQGYEVYDFSVGDEPYKRLWCNIETVQYDSFHPLTAKGRVLVAGMRSIASAKRAIKGSPLVWSLVKRLRRTSGAPVAPASTDDDKD